jgi:DNA-binding NtrC family response regulator
MTEVYTRPVKLRRGEITNAARKLGLSRPTIYAKIRAGSLRVDSDGRIKVGHEQPEADER